MKRRDRSIPIPGRSLGMVLMVCISLFAASLIYVNCNLESWHNSSGFEIKEITSDDDDNTHLFNLQRPTMPAAARISEASSVYDYEPEEDVNIITSSSKSNSSFSQSQRRQQQQRYSSYSCLSRQQLPSFRKLSSSHNSSSYLLSKLRSYEDLHRRCGAYTESYNRTVEALVAEQPDSSTSSNKYPYASDDDQYYYDCKYIIWNPIEGLGNQIISLVSTFLYALLTDRVLLVNFGPDLSNLFCEPFQTSWILPHDFPYKDNGFSNGIAAFQDIIHYQQQQRRYMLLYVDLKDVYGDRTKLFHCDHTHAFLSRVPVLLARSNGYYAPSLFMTPSFMTELRKMFPHKITSVFHLLARHLLNPSDEAWKLITDYYYHHANLANAHVKVGLQIRVFELGGDIYRPAVMGQLLACARAHDLLPQPQLMPRASHLPGAAFNSNNSSTTAVFVASLSTGYAEKLRQLYHETTSTTSSSSSSSSADPSLIKIIRVYQASSEGEQRFNDAAQNMKAWVDINLLSFCDHLITTAQSTFGYVAQGLGGLDPWMLGTLDRFPCFRALTIDPCFMTSPHYDCHANRDVLHMSHVFPAFIAACEDQPQGIRLTDNALI